MMISVSRLAARLAIACLASAAAASVHAQVVGLGTTQTGATFQLATGLAKVVSDKGGM